MSDCASLETVALHAGVQAAARQTCVCDGNRQDRTPRPGRRSASRPEDSANLSGGVNRYKANSSGCCFDRIPMARTPESGESVSSGYNNPKRRSDHRLPARLARCTSSAEIAWRISPKYKRRLLVARVTFTPHPNVGPGAKAAVAGIVGGKLGPSILPQDRSD